MSLQKFKLHTANSVVNAENQSLASMDTGALIDLFGKGDGKQEKEEEKGDHLSDFVSY